MLLVMMAHLLEDFLAVSRELPHRLHVTFAQVVHALAYVFVREAFMFESFANDLQIRHAGYSHFR